MASAVRSGELILLSEMGQVTFDPYAHPPAPTQHWRWEASLERITLQEISYDPESVLRDGEVLEWELVNQEVWSVMYYIAETYGLQPFPGLLRALPEADSLESWLQMALDVDLEAFEADWQAWLREAIVPPEP